MPGLGASFGRGAATNYEQDMANSDCILFMGTNTAEAHPVAFRWPMKAKEKGATLMHVERAVACGAAGEALGAALLVRAQALWWRGDTRGAASAAEQAMSLLREGSADWCSALTELCNALYRLGDHDRDRADQEHAT